MAVVQGIREKVHLPIYDSVHVKPKEQLRDVENGSSSTLKFFVDVQRKTKLETNLQSASLLPHYNTFEARAMRVVISDLPPQFPDEPTVKDEALEVLDENDNQIKPDGDPLPDRAAANAERVWADIDLGLDRIMELLEEARKSEDGFAAVSPTEEGVTLWVGNAAADEVSNGDINEEAVGEIGSIWLDVSTIEGYIAEIRPEIKQPPKAQLHPNNGAGTIISKFIYNTVTTLYVGEKIMIQMPTWFFPAGAGPYSEAAAFTTHGEPSPTATFRFAEPVFVDKQQNFRVEIEIPDTDVLKEVQQTYGPLFIWVVLDGYMVRDVQ